MVKRKVVFRKKRQNRLGMFLVLMVVLMLLVVVSLKERGVKAEAGDLRGAGKSPSGTDRCGKGPYGRDRGIQEVQPDQEICGRGGKG